MIHAFSGRSNSNLRSWRDAYLSWGNKYLGCRPRRVVLGRRDRYRCRQVSAKAWIWRGPRIPPLNEHRDVDLICNSLRPLNEVKLCFSLLGSAFVWQLYSSQWAYDPWLDLCLARVPVDEGPGVPWDCVFALVSGYGPSARPIRHPNPNGGETSIWPLAPRGVLQGCQCLSMPHQQVRSIDLCW